VRGLLEDEGHLVWGDGCGRAWGKRNVPIVVPMTSERERQPYYGALNLLTQVFHLYAAPTGNGGHTVANLHWCQTLYPDQQLVVLWDGASYHRGEEMQKFLAQEYADLSEVDWKITGLRFAPMCLNRIRPRTCGSRARRIYANSLRCIKPLPKCNTASPLFSRRFAFPQQSSVGIGQRNN
jgi:hypothetical protein